MFNERKGTNKCALFLEGHVFLRLGFTLKPTEGLRIYPLGIFQLRDTDRFCLQLWGFLADQWNLRNHISPSERCSVQT